MNITISIFNSCYDNLGSKITIEHKNLCNFISHKGNQLTDKKSLMCWSPAIFEAGKTRKKAHVKQVSCIVYDIDNGLNFENHELFNEWKYYAHTTFSHSEDFNKWRLILPLQKPIKKDEWPFAWLAASKLFKKITGSEIDHACKDASRIYYCSTGEAQTEDNLEANKYFKVKYSVTRQDKTKIKNKISRISNPQNIHELNYEAYQIINTDQNARIKAGELLNGNLCDGVVRSISCPQCQRASLFYFVDPTNKKCVECNHKNSCGYFVNLFDLLKMNGAI